MTNMYDNNDMEKTPLLSQRTDPAPEPESDRQPTLSELQHNVFRAQRAYMREWSRTTSGKWHKRIMLAVTTLLLMFTAFCVVVIVESWLTDDDNNGTDWRVPRVKGKVPLEAHIMSKCPDARDCLHDMILPAMQNISDEVDFRLSYIGTVTDHDDGVLCKHGPEECLGNILELCAAHLYPDPKIYLGFTMCLSHQYEDIPKRSLVEDCALEHGIAMEKLNECAVQDDGSLSVGLIRESFNRSAEAGVKTSCTVRLEGKVRCVRDGGKWKDCEGGSRAEDLVENVRELARLRW